jgi:hypothetical protein
VSRANFRAQGVGKKAKSRPLDGRLDIRTYGLDWPGPWLHILSFRPPNPHPALGSRHPLWAKAEA